MNKNTIFNILISSFLVICLLLIQFTVFSQLNSIEQYNQELKNSFELELKKLTSENADLREQLNMEPATAPTLPEPEGSVSLAGTRTLTGISILVTIAILLATPVSAWFSSRAYSRELEKRVEIWKTKTTRLQKQAYRKGAAESPNKLIEMTDVLSNILRWLSWYDEGKAKIADAAKLHRRLLKYLETAFGLRQIGVIGEVTRFDPSTHQTFDRVSTGDKVFIVEPGWRLGEKLIKEPVVSTEDY